MKRSATDHSGYPWEELDSRREWGRNHLMEACDRFFSKEFPLPQHSFVFSPDAERRVNERHKTGSGRDRAGWLRPGNSLLNATDLRCLPFNSEKRSPHRANVPTSLSRAAAAYESRRNF